MVHDDCDVLVQKTARLEGYWTRIEVDRITGERGPAEYGGYNTIQTAGKQEFLDIMFGLGGSIYNTTNAKLKVYNSTPTLLYTFACTSITHGADNSGTVTFEFDDISANVYTVYRCDIVNNASSVIFSQSTPTFTGGNTKPNSKNWLYQWTLSINQNGDTDLQMDGLDHALRLMTGNRTDTFGSSYNELYVEASGGTPNGTHSPTTGPSRSSSTVTTTYQATTTQLNQSWYNVSIKQTTYPATLNTTNTAWGTKTSDDQWTVTFTFSL